MRSISIATVVACLPLFAQAQSSLLDAPVSLHVGNWSIVRQMDPMTDKAECTGLYQKSPDIQLGAGGLYVRINGGLKSVRLRFDDEPANSTRLATRIEQQARSIIIQGNDYQRAIQSKRIRYEVLTFIGLDNGDLDMQGIEDAVAHIKAGCPMPPK